MAGTFGSSPDSLPEVAQPVFSGFQHMNGHSPGGDVFTFDVSSANMTGKDHQIPTFHGNMQAIRPPYPPHGMQLGAHPHGMVMHAALPAHAAMMPILNPLPAFASPPSSPVGASEEPRGPRSTEKRRRTRSEEGSDGDHDGSDGAWSDTPRGDDEPMPKWSVSALTFSSKKIYIYCYCLSLALSPSLSLSAVLSPVCRIRFSTTSDYQSLLEKSS